GRAQCQSPQDAFHIADPFQNPVDQLKPIILLQFSDGPLTGAERRQVAQRTVEPATQQPAAHTGGSAIEDGKQGMFVAAVQIDIQLQIAAGGRIHDDRFIAVFMGQAANMGQGSTLGFPGVTEQAASGRNGYLKVVAAKAGKILGAELLDQQPLRCLKFKFPWAASSHPFAILSQFRQRKMIADQQLRRIKPLQLSQCGLQALNFNTRKRPLAISSDAMPKVSRYWWTATSRLSRRESSSASSLTVPGVTMRTT